MKPAVKAIQGKQFRQGDTFYVPLGSGVTIDGMKVPDTIPEGAAPHKNNIVAYGEVTGHSHAVTGDFKLVMDGNKMYLSVGPEGATITHQDHAHIVVPPNSSWYVRQHQEEWTPQGRRNIAD